MEFTIQQIAFLLGGEVKGNDAIKISRLDKIQEGEEGGIAFLSNMKYEPYIYTTKASAVIVNKDFIPKQALQTTLILVEDAYTAFSKLLEEYQKVVNFSKQGIEQPSYISDNAQLGEHVYIGAFAYLGKNVVIGKNTKIYPHAYLGDNVKVGDNTIIYAGAKIYADCVIGNHVTIHSNAVIGSDGFGFAPQPDGSYKAIPQVGNVIIEDHVSIGSSTVIDCATMGSTIIKQGAKLDNLIQIAHNVVIGKHTVIAAQTGISGSTELGDNCTIAGQVGFAGHLKIANKTMVGAQSGMGKNIEQEGLAFQGYPAFDIRSFQKSTAVFRRLPEIKKQVDELEKKLINLLDNTKKN